MPTANLSPDDVGRGSDRMRALGPYEIVGRIGEGGAARVYRARHPGQSHRPFALKVLLEGAELDPHIADLFSREAYVLSMLRHPNIVQTFEAGIEQGTLYIAMEYIVGRDLGRLLHVSRARKLPIPLPVGLYIIHEILKGVACAHDLTDADGRRLDLIHRDLKPDNIFLSLDGAVKVGDFGIASMLASDRAEPAMGSIGYFAPELFREEAIDQRSDLFSVGAIAFETLCGRRLFSSDDAQKAWQQNMKASVPDLSKENPEVPPELARVIQRALEREPRRRFESADKMLEALSPFVPTTPGMPLALAGLMRTVCSDEIFAEAQRVSGGMPRKQVALLTPNIHAQEQLIEQFIEQRMSAEVHSGVDSLGETLVFAGPPQVILVDLQGYPDRSEVTKALVAAPAVAPIIAISNDLDLPSIEAAYGLGAVDLLARPLAAERLVGAVFAAPISARAPSEEADLVGQPRVLLVTADDELRSGLVSGIASGGYRVDSCMTLAEAVRRSSYSAYGAVAVDVGPDGNENVHAVSELRDVPAVGVLPVLYLTPDGHSPERLPRTAARRRSDAPQTMIATLAQILGDWQAGRSYKRYPATLTARVQSSGNEVDCRTVNVSCGGISISFPRMIAVGTRVRLSVDLPETDVKAEGRIAWVRLPEDGLKKEPELGIEFLDFEGEEEHVFISYVRSIAAVREAGS